jgi:hypothetical protein
MTLRNSSWTMSCVAEPVSMYPPMADYKKPVFMTRTNARYSLLAQDMGSNKGKKRKAQAAEVDVAADVDVAAEVDGGEGEGGGEVVSIPLCLILLYHALPVCV